MVTDLTEVRRERLKAWLVGKILPRRERSYFSQLVNGQAPFGERAARRIENEYGLGTNFLDGADKELSRQELIAVITKSLEEMPMYKLNGLATLLTK